MEALLIFVQSAKEKEAASLERDRAAQQASAAASAASAQQAQASAQKGNERRDWYRLCYPKGLMHLGKAP
eukprot:1157924-Pelagomonas_calceolata.AAC.7